MKNIELKAICSDLEKAEQIVRDAGAQLQWTKKQIDTYFNVPKGRLKLRQQEGDQTQLISYFRSDLMEKRESVYSILSIPDGDLLIEMFSQTIGIKVVVSKYRTLYLYDNVRIHLDRVDHLGTFLELEGVINHQEEIDSTRKKLEYLSGKLNIFPQQRIAFSYSDLLLQDQQGQKSNRA